MATDVRIPTPADRGMKPTKILTDLEVAGDVEVAGDLVVVEGDVDIVDGGITFLTQGATGPEPIPPDPANPSIEPRITGLGLMPTTEDDAASKWYVDHAISIAPLPPIDVDDLPPIALNELTDVEATPNPNEFLQWDEGQQLWVAGGQEAEVTVAPTPPVVSTLVDSLWADTSVLVPPDASAVFDAEVYVSDTEPDVTLTHPLLWANKSETYTDTGYLPLTGGTVTGSILFADEDEGVIVYGGGGILKRTGGGVVIRETSGGQQPKIENNDGTGGRDIIDTVNGDVRYALIGHTHGTGTGGWSQHIVPLVNDFVLVDSTPSFVGVYYNSYMCTLNLEIKKRLNPVMNVWIKAANAGAIPDNLRPGSWQRTTAASRTVGGLGPTFFVEVSTDGSISINCPDGQGNDSAGAPILWQDDHEIVISTSWPRR